MRNAGYLNASGADNGLMYRGRIATLKFARNVVFKKTAHKTSERAPDFDIYTDTGHVNVGAAWIKQGKDQAYLSIQIDDPSLSNELNFMGFKQHDSDGYDIVWKRQT